MVVISLGFMILYITNLGSDFMEKLEKEDYQDIIFLINIAKQIKKIYIKLEELEINNNKDSLEYNNLISELKRSIDIENKIYDRLKKEPNKIKILIEHLKSLQGYVEINNEVDYLYNDNYNHELIRIFRRLRILLPADNSQILDSMPEDVQKILKTALFYSNNLDKVMFDDNFKCFLVILDDEFHHLAIKEKYKISYLFSNFEEEYLNNNFVIDKTPYVLSQIFTDLFSTNNEALIYNRINAIEQLLKEQMSEIFKYNDFELNDPKARNNLIIRLTYIRSMIIFIDKQIVEKIKQEIEKFIYINSSNLIYRDKTISLVRKMYTNKNKDEEIPRILTFKKL